MATVLSELSFDAHHPLAQAHWWAEVLGWRVGDWQAAAGATDGADPEGDDPGFAWLEPPRDETAAGIGPGGVDMGAISFARVPEGKTVKNRLHLDLRPSDDSSQEAELARLLAHGARRIDVGQGPDATWHVLADPEGNEFCLLRARPAQVAQAAGTA
jgi:catechol 2,3-dioxygenase-like lactoylglutathione lyase family enzyme